MSQHHEVNQSLLQTIETQAKTIIGFSSLIVLFATLLPFNFSWPLNFSLIEVFTRTSYLGDIVANLLLFMPFGFGWAALFKKSRFSRKKIIVIALIASFILSSTVETLQIFLPFRSTSIIDVATNSCSGVLGVISFYLTENILKKYFLYLDKQIVGKILSIALIGYVIFIGGLLIFLQNTAQLSNWNEQFPLSIGNEATGDRPWEGEISHICFSDRSLPESSIEKLLNTNSSCNQMGNNLIGAYFFREKQLKYTEEAGNLPDLEWQSLALPNIGKIGLILGQNNWLKTPVSAIKLNRSIQKNSQFTITTEIISHKTRQKGPARIISLGQDHYQRNLTLAQLGTDLNLRMRTPLTGNNGSKPAVSLSDFFTDIKPHQLAISYDGKELKIYLDTIENIYNLQLDKEAAVFWSVFSILGNKTPIQIKESKFYTLAYYEFMFLPLGIILTLIWVIFQGNQIFFFLLFFSAVIIPPFLVETIIVNTSEQPWVWENVFLGIIIIALTSFIFRILIALNFKKM